MKVEETALKDCFILEPVVHRDDRGYFYEQFNRREFEEKTGQSGNFVQDNLSKSSEGTLRGLHFQKGEFAQAKLVTCLEGEILDVAVDLRQDSPTFKKWISTRLNSRNKRQLYIPRGFAHGFYVLSKVAYVQYKCDNFYHKEAEGAVNYKDPQLAVDWEFQGKPILSEKDQNAPLLSEADLF